MTLQQLNQIIAIADAGSMNEAAKKLYVSQPNLSASVKDVEEEIGLTVFIRSNRGIKITPEGEEFIDYARQVVEQYSVLSRKYIEKAAKKKFSVSCQHYSFCVKAFVDLISEVGMDEYEFAIHETTTQIVIDNVKNMKSEIGILYESDFNGAVINKLLHESNLTFEPLFICDTYVYLWKGNPLAVKKELSMDELQEYPCLAFEQGAKNPFYLAEEMKSTYEYKKIIKADDRATMLNLMVGLNGYTLCSGIICEDLNGNDYVAIPLKETEKMTIGYVRRKGITLSTMGASYLEKLKEYAKRFSPAAKD